MATPFEKLWNYQDPGNTEQTFRELLNDIDVEQDPSTYYQLLTQIARCQSLQRHFDPAHHTLNKIEKVLEKQDHLVQIRYWLERGRTFNSSGEKADAMLCFNKAAALAEENGQEYYYIDALHMLAIADEGKNAVQWNLKAMRAAEQARDERARNWLGSLYNNIAWNYFDSGDFDHAKITFQKCLEFNASNGFKRPQFVAKWSLARVERAMGNHDEALSQQLALAQEELGAQDGYVFEEIGEIYLAKGDAEAARPYFAKAYELLSKDIWLQANAKDRLERLKNNS
jgi:tetratricopeptide (TPR) repeat protein